MNYPLISEYLEAIKSAENNFKELTHLRPVLGEDGQPVMTSGNFAVVFKMKDEQTGKLYAVKCFTKEQEGRAEAYHQIAEELKDVDSPYLVSIRYLDKELFVDTNQTDETEFPVLLMDWVEGKTLDKYLRENLDDKYALEILAYRFSQLAQWLIPQPFAHGDLKPDNILVHEDGTLVLVDYDGMYVPAMKGQKARELGSPDFRHPLRTENDFDEQIDDFPLVSILLSLKAISLNNELFADYCTTNHLLFSENDYRYINDSDVFKVLMYFSDIEINKLIVAFLHYIVNSAKSRYPIIASLNSNYSPEKTKNRDSYYYLSNKYVDEFGVVYTTDKKILLHWDNMSKKETDFPTFYRVLDGTEVICDEAFMFCKNLTSIYLPKSLQQIGKSVFVGTKLSSIECNSSMFDVDDNLLFSYDRRVLYYYPENKKDTFFDVPEQVKLIVPGCFSNAKYLWVIKLRHILYDFDYLALIGIYISIPKGTKKYLRFGDNNKSSDEEFLEAKTRNNIFEGDLVVDDGVVYSSDKTVLYRFPYWSDKEEYRVNENCKIIEEAAFDDNIGYDEEWGYHIQFNKLKSLYLPRGLEEIRDYAFAGCGNLENLTIPPTVKVIGNYVFGQCVNLITLTLLSKIEHFSDKAFDIGKTMPAPLVNPHVPYAELGRERNGIDIIICPEETEKYYKKIIDNENSSFFSLNKNEKTLKLEAPDHLCDRNYFTVSSNVLQTITTSQLKEKMSEVVCTKWYGSAGKGIGIDLTKLKQFLGENVFDVYKSTNRFHFRSSLSGICYLTKNFRSKFISSDDSFTTIEDAVDFAIRVYYDVNGNVLDLDIE
ncbi:MAG: leucine-rich repeat protein [Prevotella sp.]|nr:leucine-rich repeat protein [Prevotella sp.]